MEIRVGNRIAEVELISKVGNCVRMSIDGKVLDLDVMMAENGVCSILMDGVSYNAELIRAEGGKVLYRQYGVCFFAGGDSGCEGQVVVCPEKGGGETGGQDCRSHAGKGREGDGGRGGQAGGRGYRIGNRGHEDAE